MNPIEYKRVGKYLLGEEIGKGAFGKVFKSFLETDHKKVFAIKCIAKSELEKKEKLKELFYTELALMVSLNHPNLIKLYDHLETNNTHYLVVTYCNRGDLEKYLYEKKRIPEEEAVSFLMQIMNGFQFLHRNNIIHRDIKLANIFLLDDKVIIGDFGFSKRVTDVAYTKLGTPLTMAPEVLDNYAENYTSKADLWSIGIIFYQMLFGTYPFYGFDTWKILQDIQHKSLKPFEFPKDVSISLECKNLIIDLLQYKPEKRIEWIRFFNHPLFVLHRKNKSKKIVNMTKSMISRQNEQNIVEEFNDNQKKAVKVLDEMPDLKMNFYNIIQKAEEQAVNNDLVNKLNEQQILDKINDLIEMRYRHEMEKVRFAMNCAKNFRSLAKLKEIFKEKTEIFMFIACILVKKGLLMIEHTLNSLNNRQNVYSMDEFNKFLDSDKYIQVKYDLVEFYNRCLVYSQMMNEKMRDEVKHPDYNNNVKVYNKMGYEKIIQLDKGLLEFLPFLRNRVDRFIMSPSVKAQYCLAIVSLFHSIWCDKLLLFIQNGNMFDWRSFNGGLNPDKARQLLDGLVL